MKQARFEFERDTRIELASVAWEATVLPPYESRSSNKTKSVFPKFLRAKRSFAAAGGGILDGLRGEISLNNLYLGMV